MTWIHERCYPGCFLVTRKQDDITVVCAWAMTLDMSSGNTTKCHVLFLYFGGFSSSYLEKQGCFTCFDVFFRRKVEKKIPKQTMVFVVFFPIFSIIFPSFFTLKNYQNTSFSPEHPRNTKVVADESEAEIIRLGNLGIRLFLQWKVALKKEQTYTYIHYLLNGFSKCGFMFYSIDISLYIGFINA